MTIELAVSLIVLCLIGLGILYYVARSYRLLFLIHRQQLMLAKGLDVDPLHPDNLSREVKRMAMDSEFGKHQAIMMCQEETGASFQEAVNAVEAYIQSQHQQVK